jgi:RHS repeat-associated protein
MRGSVIALTDEDGYIVETYSYDPFGNLLSTPTIYNPKLYIGRDDVLYDTETDLYYMHARYYDPEAGRFIMKDPVEGSLGNPITQNPYIYCANDPINKIDPAGTVTLGALDNPFKPKPPSKHGPTDVIPPPPKPPQCFSNQCIAWGTLNGLPGLKCPKGDPFDINEHDLPSCKIEGDDLYAYYLTGGTSDDPASASTVLGGGLEDLTSCGILPDSGIIEQPNKNYDIKYEVDEYGNVKLSAVDKAGNPVELSPEDQAILDNINKGMNDALNWLRDQGFKFNDLAASKKEIMNFIENNFTKFFRVLSFLGEKEPDNVFYEIGYHATIGLAIASKMKHFGDSRDDYDQYIGFWVSYRNKNFTQGKGKATNMGFYSSKDKKNRDTLGLVDVANLMKATIKGESGFELCAVGRNPRTGKTISIDVGLMQVNFQLNGKTVEEGIGLAYYAGLFDPFINIGVGVNRYFLKLKEAAGWKSAEGGPPSQYDWMQATWYYQGAGKGREAIWNDLREWSGKDKIWEWDPEKAKRAGVEF